MSLLSDEEIREIEAAHEEDYPEGASPAHSSPICVDACEDRARLLDHIKAMRSHVPPSVPYSVSWEGGTEVRLLFPNDGDAEAFGRWIATEGNCDD